MIKAKNRYRNVMVIPIVLGLILFALYKNSTSTLEQLMVGFLFIINLIPFTLHLVSMLIKGLIPKQQRERSAEKIINNEFNIEPLQNKAQKDSIKPQYKAKTNNNVYYVETKDRLINIVKGGQLNRDSILTFKMELDNRLGLNRYAYKDFTFENDMHEIYIKLKSSKLKDEDYIYLKDLLENLAS